MFVGDGTGPGSLRLKLATAEHVSCCSRSSSGQTRQYMLVSASYVCWLV